MQAVTLNPVQAAAMGSNLPAPLDDYAFIVFFISIRDGWRLLLVYFDALVAGEMINVVFFFLIFTRDTNMP